jgi:hypothetical protein
MKRTCTVTGLIVFVSNGLKESISATGTIGHFALVAALKLPPLKSSSSLPFLERVKYFL